MQDHKLRVDPDDEHTLLLTLVVGVTTAERMSPARAEGCGPEVIAWYHLQLCVSSTWTLLKQCTCTQPHSLMHLSNPLSLAALTEGPAESPLHPYM